MISKPTSLGSEASVETSADKGHSVERVAIWDKIEAIMRDVPDEVLASIPTEVKHD